MSSTSEGERLDSQRSLRMTNCEPLSAASSGETVTVAVIIVTYDSGSVIHSCLHALAVQTRRPDSVQIIDNKSPDSDYIDEIEDYGGLSIRLLQNSTNEGFCVANNIGYRLVNSHTYVVFLNPDAFLEADVIQRAVEWMERPENVEVAMLSGTLLAYDIRSKQRTGAVDSTGVFQTWYGKWYDRDQGKKWVGTRVAPGTEDVPAISGAFMFCRARAIESVRAPNGDVFDGRFFMYKEDIDLSIRLRKRGWRLVFSPSLIGEHCRGWRGRSNMSMRARYMSARNELRVCFANNGRGLLYSTLKFLFVPLEDFYLRVFRPGSR